MSDPPYKTGKSKDLHYAAHRFESTQVPLAEMAVWILAAVALAHEIAAVKGTTQADAGIAAQAFINGLNASASAQSGQLFWVYFCHSGPFRSLRVLSEVVSC